MDQHVMRNSNGNGRGRKPSLPTLQFMADETAPPKRVGQGYGCLQLKLLKTLEEHPAFFLVDVLGHPYARSQYVALHRAAQNLCQQRKLDICKLGGGGTNTMWIARVGYRCAHHEVPRINGADQQEGDVRNGGHARQQAERRQQVERARARMSPGLLEKMRIVGETGELPEEARRPAYRRF
jgi:hypothetical protein